MAVRREIVHTHFWKNSNIYFYLVSKCSYFLFIFFQCSEKSVLHTDHRQDQHVCLWLVVVTPPQHNRLLNKESYLWFFMCVYFLKTSDIIPQNGVICLISRYCHLFWEHFFSWIEPNKNALTPVPALCCHLFLGRIRFYDPIQDDMSW